MALVFVSHSSKDILLVKNFVELLQLGMNLNRDDIFCSSLSGNLPSGKNFISEIRKKLVGCEAVIFLITEAYMNSPFCLAELGAAWALGQTIIPLMVDPMTHQDVEQTPLLGTQCLKLLKRNDLFQLGNIFIEQKIKQFNLPGFYKYVDEFLAKNGVVQHHQRKVEFTPNPKIQKYLAMLTDRAATDVEAQFLLGTIYWEGILAKQDKAKATQLFTQAAYSNYAPAQYKLSSMYYKGETGEHSFEKAFEWEEKASAGDNPVIWDSLAFLYRSGLGCKRDLDKALDCYLRAVEQGHKTSYYSIAEIHSIQANSAKTIECYKKSLQAGYQHAALYLGLLYKEGGKDFPPNYAKAAQFFSIAEQAGITEAKYEMGQLYYMGYAVFERDFNMAAQWLEKAAKEGHDRAQYNLAYMYHHGLGVKYDWNLATYWYEQAARRGHRLSQVDVADLYALADKQEYQKAMHWYTEATKQGSCDAHRKLGDMYFFGIGCAVDQVSALNHYMIAAEQKDYVAQFRLEGLEGQKQ